MITWIQMWPILTIPFVIVTAAAAIPTAVWNGRILGGGPIREWLLNHLLLPVLPQDAGASLVGWFQSANALQEWSVSALIALNINAVLLPLLFGLGHILIQTTNWFSNKDLELKRRAAR
jgi:hypothetical protein